MSVARHPVLGFAFARSQRIVLEDGPDGRVLLVDSQTPASAISEVLRLHAAPDQVETLAADELDRRLSSLYANRSDGAAGVVDDIGDSLDLNAMVDSLPEVEDLLESEGDAPIIRMINALLTQAPARWRLGHPYRSLRRPQPGALPPGWHAARRGHPAPRLARGHGVAAEDHGQHGHCRKAPAARWPHLAAPGRPPGGRAGVHAAHQPRRTRGAAAAG